MTTQTEVFGPGRLAAARKAYQDWRNAVDVVEAAGGGWAPESLHERERQARRLRAMYAEYGDSVLAAVI